MIFSSSILSDRKPMAVFAIALVSSVFCAACADDAAPPIYLGIVDGGLTNPDSQVQEDSSIPTPKDLDTPTVCKSDPISGPDVASTIRTASAANARLLLTLNRGIAALKLDAQGCPSGPVPGFGTNGFVEIAAVSAVPLEAGRSLIATESDLQILDSEGKNPVICPGSKPARLIALRSDGSGYSAFARAPLQTIDTKPACAVGSLPLTSEPFLIAAISPRSGTGFMLAEQETPASALLISRYDSAGTRLASSPKPLDASSPAHLCSVSAMVETQAGLVVTDATCKRLVIFDENLIPVAQRTFDQTPRGVVALDDPSKVLVVLTAPTASGAEASFVTVSLK